MAKNKEVSEEVTNVTKNEPTKIPMNICLTMGHRTHPLAWCARKLDIDVKMIEAIQVAKARCIRLSLGKPWCKKMAVNPGTIIAPPPMPNNPAVKPTIEPINSNAMITFSSSKGNPQSQI